MVGWNMYEVTVYINWLPYTLVHMFVVLLYIFDYCMDYEGQIKVYLWVLEFLDVSPEPPLNQFHLRWKYISFHGWTALVGLGLPIVEVSRSHSDTSQSVGLLWTRDRPVAETSTWQSTTLTRDRYPCSRRNSNQQSQEARGLKHTP
jgi:hypothetical protein